MGVGERMHGHAGRQGEKKGRAADFITAMLRRCPPFLQVEEALVFAEEELVPLGEDHPELMEDLEEVMALFAFPDKEACVYSDYPVQPCARAAAALRVRGAANERWLALW